jgi:hypothetical protein
MNFDVKGRYIFMMRQPCSLQFYNYHRGNKYTDSQKEKVFIADISKSGRMGYNNL